MMQYVFCASLDYLSGKNISACASSDFITDFFHQRLLGENLRPVSTTLPKEQCGKPAVVWV